MDIEEPKSLKSDNDPELEVFPHEFAFFYRARIKQEHITVLPSDYKVCPDYAFMYSKLSESPMLKEMMTRLNQQYADSKRGKRVPRKDRIADHTDFKQATRLAKYFIDPKSKMLYIVSGAQEELLCIPNTKLRDERPNLRSTLILKIHNNVISIHLGMVLEKCHTTLDF
eukprot:SAG11_NODE_360_length_10188_cov_25.643671_4_plen_169_part_00